MDNNAEALIASLTPEIEKKCAEIKETRAERSQSIGFVLLCAAVILIPTLLVFFDFSLSVLIIPVLFATAAVLLLSPVLINQQGGHVYE